MRRNKVFLAAKNALGEIVEEWTISNDEYYEGSLELIDSDIYRTQRKIVQIVGSIYDSSGKLQQHFENHYSKSGKYIGGKTVHSDGTIFKDE